MEAGGAELLAGEPVPSRGTTRHPTKGQSEKHLTIQINVVSRDYQPVSLCSCLKNESNLMTIVSVSLFTSQ